jgi:hypothetical protein
MSAYDAYMQKQALNAMMKRIDFKDLSVGYKNHPGHNTRVNWKPTGQEIGESTTEYRNANGNKDWHAPSNTASMDWITLDAKDMIKANLGGLMKDRSLSKKMLGRTAWQAHQNGMSHMTGDWRGVFTNAGSDYTKQMTDQVAKHAPVKMIDPPQHADKRINGMIGAGEKKTPIVNLDDYFANHRASRSVDRQAQTAAPVHDTLANTSFGQRDANNNLVRRQFTPARRGQGFANSRVT